MQPFDLDLYLDRIGLESAAATKANLFSIQTCQLKSLIFEDIDPLLGRTPSIDISDICSKILIGGRGGYCFELNTLLEAALKAIGFNVERSMARVRMGADGGGPRSHLVLRVPIGAEEYLVDAGFGGPGSLIPLSIETATEQVVPNGTYRLRPDETTGEIVVERLAENGWFALFGFDRAHVGDADIEAANHLCATWSKMPFSSNLMVNGFEGDARIGIFRNTVTTESPEGMSRRDLTNAKDLYELLGARLGLELSEAAAEDVWARMFPSESGESSDDRAA